MNRKEITKRINKAQKERSFDELREWKNILEINYRRNLEIKLKYYEETI